MIYICSLPLQHDWLFDINNIYIIVMWNDTVDRWMIDWLIGKMSCSGSVACIWEVLIMILPLIYMERTTLRCCWYPIYLLSSAQWIGVQLMSIWCIHSLTRTIVELHKYIQFYCYSSIISLFCPSFLFHNKSSFLLYNVRHKFCYLHNWCYPIID